MSKVNREELIGIVREIVVGNLGISESALVPEATLREDLGLDSIDMFDILVFVEQKTGTRLYGDQFKNISTVKEFLDLLEQIVNRDTEKRNA